MKKLTERDLNYVIDNGIIDTAYIQEYSVQVNRTYYTFDTSTMKDKTDIVAKIHTCG